MSCIELNSKGIKLDVCVWCECWKCEYGDLGVSHIGNKDVEKCILIRAFDVVCKFGVCYLVFKFVA